MGGGSGDAQSLSAEAVRVLRSAEVVLHDAEVSQEVLDLTPASAQVRNAEHGDMGSALSQEKIQATLIAAAREGHQVVRLKAGDEPLAGSAGELEALQQAGVEFEVISGTGSAIGAAAGSR